MTAKTYRQVHRLNTATLDIVEVQIAPKATLQTVSVVAGDLSQGPLTCNMNAVIEGLSMFLKDGEVRGYSITGGGITWEGAIATGEFEQPHVQFVVRNDTGGTLLWVHQITVDL